MANKLIQIKDKSNNNLYPNVVGEGIPADAITSDKIQDNAVTETKLAAELDKKITDSKTISDTLIQGLSDPNHLEDPFVRSGMIPIPFEDAEVKRILVEKYDTDGDGELYFKDVQTIDIASIFADNTKIKSFNEFRFFNPSALKVMLSDATENRWFYGCSNLESIEFPEGLTFINSFSFKNCTNLKLDYLPDSIKNLGRGSFTNCSSLKLTKLPDNLKSIGWYCFSECINCEFKETPVGLTIIPEGWANNNKAKTLDILSPNVSQLDWNSLGVFTQWVAFHATTPPTCTSAAFNANATIYVPDDAVDTYKNATGFKDMADRIKPLSEKPAN